MIYVIYKDDGAQGCGDQSMSRTAPRHKLYLFEDEKLFIKRRDELENNPPPSRKNPRFEEVFSDDENLGYREAVKVKE